MSLLFIEAALQLRIRRAALRMARLPVISRYVAGILAGKSTGLITNLSGLLRAPGRRPAQAEVDGGGRVVTVRRPQHGGRWRRGSRGAWIGEVTFAVGIFDLFTYTIPGSLYLAFFGYLAARLHWIDPVAVGRTPVLLLVIAIVLLSYLLGYMAYPLGAAANRVVPRRRERRPRQEFVSRVPAARGRDYVRADPFLLLSAVQLHDKDVAVEVTRLRAAGLMLRNSAPALALGFFATIVELILGRNPVLPAGSALLLAGGFFSLIIQGRRLRHWASLKTLELCFWLPDVDERCRGNGTGTESSTQVPG